MAENTNLTDGKAEDILATVGNDDKQAIKVYREERQGKARKGLMRDLKKIVQADMPLPAWAEKRQVTPAGARMQMAKTTLAVFEGTEAYSDVEEFIQQGDHRNTGVRLDTFDDKQLDKLSEALFNAADETDGTGDFRTLLRSSKVAGHVAETARQAANDAKEAEQEAKTKAKEAVASNEPDVEADAQAIVDETVS